jgi:glycosyltransferase involved in cell wall biosynthesis
VTAAPAGYDRLRVALYTGVCVEHDAMSTSVRYKLDALRALRRAGAPVDVTLVTQHTDLGDPDVRVVTDVHRLACTDTFDEADIHVFEFGIRYDLFDAVFLIPSDRSVMAVYHNVTPPHLAHTDPLRRTLEASLVQKHNLFRADSIVTDSEYNREDLLEFGVQAPIEVVHLPPALSPFPPRTHDPRTVDLLFVGRLVAAKGVIDLMRAFAAGRG